MHLVGLPIVPPSLLYSRQLRRVSNDGYIHYRSNWYPVPMRFCLDEVLIEPVYGRLLHIYAKSGELIGCHEVAASQKKERPNHPEHDALNELFKEKRRGRQALVLEQFVSMFGDIGKEYTGGLKERVGLNLWGQDQPLRGRCPHIMQFTRLYDCSLIKESMRSCILIGAFHKNSVLRLLNINKVPFTANIALYSGSVIPRGNIKRDLSFYAGLSEEVSHA